jgi:two-component system, OmpR family, KDP operon response regulator KdpE
MYQTLIVDDEQNIRTFIGRALELVGYEIELAADGKQALDLIRDKHYDLVFLDLNLGGKVDGLRVLEAIRWRWPDTAVIILTGHGSLESAMQAIREGVDIYLLKPVGPDQIRDAAQEAIEKRKQYFSLKQEEAEQVELRVGPVYVHKDKLIVKKNDQEVDLTSREFGLLVYLMQNTHRVVPPKELAREVGGFSPESSHEARNYIKWYVHQLRQKIEADPANPTLIQNIREGGYRFIPPAETS